MSTLPPKYGPIKETGVYDQLPADVKQQIASMSSTTYPASVTQKAEKAMADEVAKPETQDKLMEEVKALGDSVSKCDEAFERVRVGLGKVDNNNYKDKNGNPIPKFQPTWTGYQKTWTDLLWQSRDTATATEAYIKDFVNVVVPGVEAIVTVDDMADAKLDLDAFAKRTDPFGKKLNSSETASQAQKYSQAFTDLRRKLEEFKGTFDDFAKDHAIELNANITAKENEITTLNLEIKKCQTVVMAMGIALGVTVFVTGAAAVGCLAAFGPVGPLVAIGVLIVGAIAAISELGTLIAYIVKTNDYKAKLTTAQNELAALKAQLEQLKQLKAILESQKADITDICGRLDRFAAVWGTVKHDAELISQGLQAAVGDEGSRRAFKERVRLLKESYTKLGDALNLYATTVSKSTTIVSKPPAAK